MHLQTLFLNLQKCLFQIQADKFYWAFGPFNTGSYTTGLERCLKILFSFDLKNNTQLLVQLFILDKFLFLCCFPSV